MSVGLLEAHKMERRRGEGRRNAMNADGEGCVSLSICLANLAGSLCLAMGVFRLVMMIIFFF